MPFYYKLRRKEKPERDRILAGLMRLRAQLDQQMPQKTRSQTLILGTWNIRNFDDNRFVNGFRTLEDLSYLAEILSRFDVIAVQEICEDLTPLKKLMRLMGPDYGYILTDKTEGTGGNDERLGFIYDKAKVRFTGVAGELVLPDSMQIIDGEKKRQFSRTPYMCEFQAGWFKFKFSTVHIYYGEKSGQKYEHRVKEIGAVAKFLAKRAKKDSSSHVLVGDFNIEEKGSAGYNALEKKGFAIFQNRTGSNLDQTKYYDQISFISKKDEVQICQNPESKGVLPFLDSLYREEDFGLYRKRLVKAMDEKVENQNAKIAELKGKIDRARTANSKANYRKKIEKAEASILKFIGMKTDDVALKEYYLKEWRTFHGSDHLPLWVELNIDFSDAYLESLA